MSGVALLVAQAKNNAWANQVLHRSISQMSDAQFLANYPSFFGSIPRALNHIYEVDLYYIDALTEGGLGRSVFDRTDIDDRATLATKQAASDARLIAHCEALSPALLAALVQTERADGPVSERRDHLLLHVFQHQVHHRGQVHGMLSQAGMDPPQLDDFFLEYGRVPSAKPYWE